MLSDIEMLALKVRTIKETYHYSLREIGDEISIHHLVILNLLKGRNITYESGKKIERWAMNFKEPRTITKDGIVYVEKLCPPNGVILKG